MPGTEQGVALGSVVSDGRLAFVVSPMKYFSMSQNARSTHHIENIVRRVVSGNRRLYSFGLLHLQGNILKYHISSHHTPTPLYWSLRAISDGPWSQGIIIISSSVSIVIIIINIIKSPPSSCFVLELDRALGWVEHSDSSLNVVPLDVAINNTHIILLF